MYLWCQEISLVLVWMITDHKPLLGLLGEIKVIPTQASARIQRWALTLAAYEYTFRYRPGGNHGNADTMSHLPLQEESVSVPVPEEVVLLMEHLQDSPASVADIRKATSRHPVLSRVRQFVQCGWPNQCREEELKPFCSRQTELSVQDGCLLWGNRVVVPPSLQSVVLMELQAVHPGVSQMKSLARMYVWWPGIDSDIESLVRSCQSSQPAPPPAPLHPWSWPGIPWSRLHMDFAGLFMGQNFLVLVDAHSKWIKVFPMSSTTFLAVVERLRVLFAQFGIPQAIVTDDGSAFVSQEFKSFLQSNGIKHVTSSPYHPASNGLAERAVKTFKTGLKKMTDGTTLDKLSRFLFAYRNTPQTTTGVSPAELLLGHRLRSRLDLLKPDLQVRVLQKQQQQKSQHDCHSKPRGFQLDDRVFVKNFCQGSPWVPGTIVKKKTGPVSYIVKVAGSGQLWRRHVDHIRIRYSSTSETSAVSSSAAWSDTISSDSTPTTGHAITTTGPIQHYPTRVRHPPDRLTY